MQGTEGDWDQEIKAVIFDLDNTLFDFIEAKFKACDAVTEYLGLEDDLLEYFFRGKYDIEDEENIRDYLKDNDVYSEETYSVCSKIYEKTKLDSVEIYEGVERTLDSIKEMCLKIVVVTDANKVNAEARIKKLKLSKYIDYLITHESTGKKKPHHMPFLHAVKKLGLKHNEIVMVGDSPERDLKPSREIGFYTVYAEYGDRNIDQDTEPVYDSKISSPEGLLDVLKSI